MDLLPASRSPVSIRSAALWQRFSRAAGHAVFRCRDVLAPLAVIALAASARRQDFLAPPIVDPWLDALGVLAIAAGLAIRFLVIATSGIRRSGVRKRVVAPTLYDTGPYAWCRNPLYVGNAIILTGLTLAFDSRWMAGLALPAALLAIRSIVAAEERVLTETFGPRYDRYCRRVPRFVPRLASPLRGGAALDWRRALRKEHGTIFAAVTAAIVLLAAEGLARAGSAAWQRRGPILLAVWILAAASWAVVRRLKSTGRLHDPRVPVRATEVPAGDVAA